MKHGYKYLFLVVFSFATLSITAQDTIFQNDTSSLPQNLILPKANNLFSSRIAFAVPNAISNSSFRKSFVGIYQVTGNFNMKLNKWLFIGVSFSNTVLQINRNIMPNSYVGVNVSRMGASMNIYSAGFNMGGDFYVGDKNRTIFSADASIGQTYVKYQSFVCKDPTKQLKNTDFTSLYFQTGISMLFLVDQNWGIGPIVNYNLIAKSFNPFDLCLDDWANYSKNTSGTTQYVSFGFVCHYSFFKK